MRVFVKLAVNVVIAQIEADRSPFPDPLPADVLEVTGRGDGPWMGKVYDPNTQNFSVPTPPAPSKARLEILKLPFTYQIWQLWKNTRLEAVARAAPAALITALGNREDAAWTAYVSDLQEWRQAS